MALSRRQLSQLKLIKLCPRRKRKELFKKIPNAAIKTVGECCLNTLRGNISLTQGQKKALSRHKKVLRVLSERKVPLFKKRKLIIQKGGFLNYLIPAALTALTNLF